MAFGAFDKAAKAKQKLYCIIHICNANKLHSEPLKLKLYINIQECPSFCIYIKYINNIIEFFFFIIEFIHIHTKILHKSTLQ